MCSASVILDELGNSFAAPTTAHGADITSRLPVQRRLTTAVVDSRCMQQHTCAYPLHIDPTLSDLELRLVAVAPCVPSDLSAMAAAHFRDRVGTPLQNSPRIRLHFHRSLRQLAVMQRLILAFFLIWSACTVSDAVPASINVRLSMAEVVTFKLGSPLSSSFNRTYNAVPQVHDLARVNAGVVPTASFTVIYNTSSQDVMFGSIAIKNLTGDLRFAHIHGPCPVSTDPCDAGVVYTICGGGSPFPACPTGSSPTIPPFIVDITQVNGGVASAVGLFQGIMHNTRLYYVNFHTSK